jgi:hypothetical protein
MARYYADRGVLFLEHDVDNPKGDRVGRWLASGGDSSALPLTMFESGRWAKGGPVEYTAEFPPIVETALQRPPLASISAAASRDEDTLTVLASVRNLTQARWEAAVHEPTAHLLLYEPTKVHNLGRFVRAGAAAPLGDVGPGEAVTVSLATGYLAGLDWDIVRAVVLADYRPVGGSGPYDSLQAAPVSLGDELRGPPTVTRLTKGEWTIDLVDTPGLVGSHASLALDGRGLPRVAYRHFGAGELRHARRIGGSWRIEVVDGGSTADVGHNSSIAVGSDGLARIAYYDRTNGDLKLATERAAGWELEVVDDLGDVGRFASLALDSRDRPHVSYVDFGTGALRYAVREEGGWRRETVDAQANEGANWSVMAVLARGTSIAVDPDDRPHIAYYDDALGQLKYAMGRADRWIGEIVDRAPYAGLDASIVVGGDGRPRIAYCDFGADDLKAATRSATRWTIETVDADGLVGLGASLALDSENRRHIAYREYGAALGAVALRHAHETAEGWHSEVVDNGPKAGRYPWLVLDGADEPHVAYLDDDFQNLRYAERMPPIPRPTATPRPTGGVAILPACARGAATR